MSHLCTHLGGNVTFKIKDVTLAISNLNVNGWFWADGNIKIPPTNKPSRFTFWSRSGEEGRRQPDNYMGLRAGRLDHVEDRSGLTVEDSRSIMMRPVWQCLIISTRTVYSGMTYLATSALRLSVKTPMHRSRG